MERWASVEKLVKGFYGEVARAVTERVLEEKANIFFDALAGRVGRANARAERVIVTMLGDWAPRFFEVWFLYPERLEKPFDFKGLLGGRVWSVKVVSGPDAFNSAQRRAVSEAALRLEKPVILTLQGGWFPRRVVEVETGAPVPWLSAPESWELVTGEKGAYRRFAGIVYRVAREHREVVVSRIIEASRARSPRHQPSTAP